MSDGDQHVELIGEVVKIDKGGFRIQIDEMKEETVVFARLGGRLRKNKIRILLGDKVTVKVSVHDLSHGFITLRH